MIVVGRAPTELGGDTLPRGRARPAAPGSAPLGFWLRLAPSSAPVRDTARHHCRDDRQQNGDHLAEPILHQDHGWGHQTALAVAIRKAAPTNARCCLQREPAHRAPSATTGKRKKQRFPAPRPPHGTLGQKDRQRTCVAQYERCGDPMTATMRIAKSTLVGAIRNQVASRRHAAVSTALPDHAAWQVAEECVHNAGAGLHGRRLRTHSPASARCPASWPTTGFTQELSRSIRLSPPLGGLRGAVAARTE